MKRTLVIGDIHGGYKALIEILEKAKVTPSDTLIFLGDYVDGWSQSPEVLTFLIALKQKQNCIFIKGNHDELLLDWLQNNTKNIDEQMWYKHGGEATVAAYSTVTKTVIDQHIDFLKSLQNYYLDSQNRLFIHAGFTNMKGIEHEYFPKLFSWDRTLWETAVALNPNLDATHVHYPKRLKRYNEIYIGHTPTTLINSDEPCQRANVWNLDTGAAFLGKLSILDINTKQFWQSQPVAHLYPNEKGRN